MADVTPIKQAASQPAYQRILPLRTRHIEGEAVLVEGVRPDHDSAQMAARLRAMLAAPPGVAAPRSQVASTRSQ